MKTHDAIRQQQGVALVVALLFLLVVTVISVIAASNSALGLKMSANMQDASESFQSAEAGIIATLSLAGTANDPFDGDGSQDIFRATDGSKYWVCDDADNPLGNLNDAGACKVETDVFLTTEATEIWWPPAWACLIVISIGSRLNTRHPGRRAPKSSWAL